MTRDQLDDQIDGILIRSENFSALQHIATRYVLRLTLLGSNSLEISDTIYTEPETARGSLIAASRSRIEGDGGV